MKSILFVIEHLYCGGVEKCLIELLNNLDYDKYRVDLLLFNEFGELIKDINPNVNVKFIIQNKKYENKYKNKIYKSIKTRLYRRFPILINRDVKDKKYDVEIAYMHGYITKLVSSINSNSKKIAWIHTDLEKCQIAQSSKLERYLPKFNQIICVSKGVKKSTDKMFQIVRDRTIVIYNIINKDKIKKLSNENVNYIFKKNTIIGVGRFYPIKRFDLIIKAHKLLKDEGIESNVILVGYGGSEEEYKDLIKQLDVEDSVQIVGFKENPYPYINNSDIFVLSSNHEGLPTVVCEAMTLGKPIISTRCSGAIELIEDDKYGILVSCGDEYELKEALKKVISDSYIKKSMQRKSIERSDIFDTKKILNKLENIFED